MIEGTIPSKSPAPSVDDIARVAAMTDPALRNLKITQAYHDLKLALTGVFGSKDVTWCAYATWASKTAGRFIRGEEIPKLVQSYLDRSERVNDSLQTLNAELSAVHPNAPVEHSAVADILESVVRGVMTNVGQGNLIVFQELGPPYARMLTEFANAQAFDQRVIDRFVSQFKPGPVEQGGQSFLIEAFTYYYQALFEHRPKPRAELLFLANALAGYHEQIRLQGPIVASLDAPIQAPFMSLFHDEAKRDVPEAHHSTIGHLVERVLRPVATVIEEEWQDFSTRWLMTLELPDVTLDLGKDVPPLANGKSFPDELATVEYPRLVELLSQLDRTPNSLHGSAAHDWASLSDRMNYVVDFFRSRQQDPALYQSPFGAAQVELFDKDVMPPGPL